MKSITYAYPTSPDADRYGFPRGCYTVELAGRSIAAFASLDAAVSYAGNLSAPWSPYSLR